MSTKLTNLFISNAAFAIKSVYYMHIHKTDDSLFSERNLASSQQTRDSKSMLAKCWASIVDDGRTLNQDWFNVSCLLCLYYNNMCLLHLSKKQTILFSSKRNPVLQTCIVSIKIGLYNIFKSTTNNEFIPCIAKGSCQVKQIQ